MTLFVKYPVLTIQITVSAISCGRPRRPTGIPSMVSYAHKQQSTILDLLTLRKFLAVPCQKFCICDQGGCNTVHRYALFGIGASQPMYKAMHGRFGGPVALSTFKGKLRRGVLRVVRTHDSSREAGYGGVENNTAPAFLNHRWHAELCQQESGSAVRAPS